MKKLAVLMALCVFSVFGIQSAQADEVKNPKEFKGKPKQEKVIKDYKKEKREFKNYKQDKKEFKKYDKKKKEFYGKKGKHNAK